jgi:hypothetical protein
VITPGALTALATSGEEPAQFLRRHIGGDWGEVNATDCEENEVSLTFGSRLLSGYRTSAKEKLWIITEADRSVTTILLPEEY